ncbi:glycosyltransferase [Kamptonema sp. UHCC 0994]|uniref:O-linked N-acetylglucosamine transferase family protein n=1 Tax=Kamptonema sp. UHCC 0994 TaxID=3031329 RepID=UPI0023B92643|nr:glycosyltransferase [Kamptonema sp. UHCC 0994]MDF0553486.1 glycosyltransferase [Kamptonema sp. UHCC 0994]
MKNLSQPAIYPYSSSKRILLGQLGLNGDCLHATTLARQIKHDYPNCHLTWAISSMCRSVIEENPFVDEIWEIPANNWQEIVKGWYWLEKELRVRLNRGEFDEVFLTQVSPNNYQNYDGTTKASLFRGYPKPITVPIQNILHLRNDEIERVRNFAEQHNLLKRSHVILFEFTGSSSQSFVKPEYALSVAQSLLSRLPDCSIILSSSMKVLVTDERIIDGSVLTLRENAELTKYCSLLIGCSSGVTQTVLTDWAKPLPMIQLLLASTSVYASIAHDLEYWKQSSEQVLEMTDCSVEHAVECAYTALVEGFSEARCRFHQQIPLNFNFYFQVVHQALLQNWQYLKAAQSVLHTTERYGWHPQLTTFVKNDLIPKIDVNKTLQITEENYGKFLQEFVGEWAEDKKVTVSAIAPESTSQHRPFWSVMIPTYNPKDHYFEETLKSVLEQASNSNEMQIEVVDDCSTHSDLVEEIVRRIGNGRISFYRQPQNLGQIANWNDCIQRAHGNWIHILHQDDIVLPGFYRSLQVALEKNQNVGAAFCRHYYIDEEGKQRFFSEIERETAGIIENFLERIAVRQRIQFASIVVSRSVYEKLGKFDPQAASAADWEMWKRISVHCQVWYEPQFLACFRLHSASETSRLMQSGGNIADAHKAIKISQCYLPKNMAEELSNQAKEHYAIEAMKMAHSMIAKGDINSAIAQIREGLKCSNSAEVTKLIPAGFQPKEVEQEQQNNLLTLSPKIIIDGVMFQIHNSGITRVWLSLITEWATQDFAQHILVLDRNGTLPKIPGIKYRQISAYDYNNTEADREMLQKICDEEQADLFISTYYTTPRSTPSVFMAYDMIPEVMGANLANPMWIEKHQGIRHASAYIAISESTARDLVKYFPDISPESITVAHCGIDRKFSPSTLVEINQFKVKYDISKPYFIWVGDRVGFNGYKNAVFFFQALSQLENKHQFEIVCVGGNSVLETELKAYTYDIKIHLLKLSDDELRSAYSGALALVQTSKYEGFGLPLLEAISCGCPVIASQNSSIPEVVGQAALYVNGEDVKELKTALIDVQSFHTRQALIAAGLEQAKKFSWSEMAGKVSSSLIAATKLSSKTSITLPPSMTSLISIIEQYQSNQSDSSALANIRQARKQIADRWLNSSTLEQLANAYAGETGKIHEALLNSGIKDETLTDEEQTFVNQLATQIAKGFDEVKTINYLLAAMLYRRADRLPIKYERAAIPNWFVNDYLKFMFVCPNLFQEIGEADNYYRYLQGWLDYVHTNIFNNQDSQIWQNIALFFSQIANFIPLYFTTANLRDIYTKRADIMELVLKNRGFQVDYVFPPRPATRSKIRLGVLNDHFAPQTETFATLPVFEHLDRSKFEIFLYALNVSGHQLEQYCQSRVDKLVPLPKDFALQVQTIRDDDLDILFIGTNLTAINKPTTSLALHRLARVQTTSFCSPTTTGMRHLDYYIAGKWTIPDISYKDQYREGLAILDGSGFCFNYATQSEVPTLQPTRNSLGISEHTNVFISGANFYKILPELRESWAKILAAVPNSMLILYPFGPAWTRTYPATPFVNNLYAVLAKYGVDSKRLLIVKQLPSRGDVKEFLRLADVYLDSYPYAGATSLIDPLQVGLPTVVMEGNALRFRQGSAMLRELEIPELITNSQQSYLRLAVALGSNPQLRQIHRQKIQQKMQSNPRFLDAHTYSLSIGKLFQELFQKWQNSQSPLGSSVLAPSAEFINKLVDCVNLYRTNSSAESTIASLRQIRKQFADYWLSVTAEQLETIYQSDVGKGYKILLCSDFQNQPLTEEERVFLQQLIQISKGLVHPKAINSLLAGMLYFTPGTMRIPDAKTRLPRWLIEDYEQVFESEVALNFDSINQPSASQLLAQYISSPQFLNQLLGCVNLYRIDPTDESVVMELRQIRKQIADFWLSVSTEELETIYMADVGKGYQAILYSGFQNEPMLETEQVFLQELTEIGKGLVHPKAINSMLGAMLYLPPGKMRVPDAKNRLPKWLISDYDKVFESVFAAAEIDDTLSEPITQAQNLLPQFLSQLFSSVHLYEIDSTSELLIADLRRVRKQLADLWLKVPAEQLQTVYQGDLGKGYKALLGCGIINQPLIESEGAFLNSLVTELSKGMTGQKAINHLLAAMLYCRPGQLQVQDANNCLPQWLLEDYEKFVKGGIKVAVKRS